LQRRLAVDALASRIREQLGDVELEKSLEVHVEDVIASMTANASDDNAVVAMLAKDSEKVVSAVMAKGRDAKVAQFVAELKGMNAEDRARIMKAM
jgi:acetyl-CoA carboxylase/biotin carboxylase 1